MSKHLIVLGFAKCGTSLLHEVLKDCNEFHLPIYKETDFFSVYYSKNLERYFEKYSDSERAKAENKIFFDSSPTYFGQNYLTVLERIKASLGDSAKFIICLRNPVYRAFSHYKHQINAHFARYGFFFKKQETNFRKVYDKSFFDLEVQNNSIIIQSYLEKIIAAQKILGKNNIIYFNLESDVKNFNSFYQKLCNFMDIDYKPYFKDRQLPKVLVGDYMSHYKYAKRDFMFTYNDKLYAIERGGLFLLNNCGNELFPSLDLNTITSCLSASYRWTSFLHEDIARKIFAEKFASDCYELENLIDLDFASWKKFKSKTTPLAQFQPKYCENGVFKQAKKVTIQASNIAKQTVASSLS